jgi:hypothetical protein
MAETPAARRDAWGVGVGGEHARSVTGLGLDRNYRLS